MQWKLSFPLCLYLSIHNHKCVYIYIYTHVYRSSYLYIILSLYIYIIYRCVCVYICIYICVCLQWIIYNYICIYTTVYIYTHSSIYIYMEFFATNKIPRFSPRVEVVLASAPLSRPWFGAVLTLQHLERFGPQPAPWLERVEPVDGGFTMKLYEFLWYLIYINEPKSCFFLQCVEISRFWIFL